MRFILVLMGVLVSCDVFAAAPAPTGAASFESFLPLIIIFVLFYFLFIRPQMKQRKAHRALLTQLGVGDEVVTSGGILGKVVSVTEQFCEIEIDSKVKMKLQKDHVTNVLPKGTMKTA